MLFPKFPIEILERNSLVSLGHVIQSLLNSCNILHERLRIGVLWPPFVQCFFRGQNGSAILQFITKEMVELTQIISGLGTHWFFRGESFPLV